MIIQSACNICAFNFDFIGLISEMDRDMRRLMKELKVESPTYDEIQRGFQSANSHSTKHSNLKIEEEFAKMTDIERANLLNIYADDYAAFGLPIPDFAKPRKELHERGMQDTKYSLPLPWLSFLSRKLADIRTHA